MEELIEELTKVTPNNLSEEGLKLFNKINEIIDKNKELEANNYESNNIISDLLDTVKKQEKIIDLMSERLTTPIHSKEWVKRYYEEEVGD